MAAVTRNTIQSEAAVVGVIAAAFACYLLVYAAMFAIPAWTFAAAEPRYTAVTKGKVGTMFELDALTQALRASPWKADLSRAAFVQMLTAQQVGLGTFRATTRLTAARRDLRLGLSASPSDAYAWTRLAISEQRIEHEEDAARALSLALQVAPAERKLTAVQFDLAVILWAELDTAGRDALARRLKWAEGRADLKTVLAENSATVLRERLKQWRRDRPW
ncbi:MAG: hypothetical protein HOP13_19950 [Alphaproteobacteria bacterium]|nr:hypothetical protein [Alphaproteobacteria bacterium]